MLSKRQSLFVFCCLLLANLCFMSCSNDDDERVTIVNDVPGQISGLGNNRGELTGTKFTLPDGITLKGNIVGYWVSDNSLSLVINGLYEDQPTLRDSDTDLDLLYRYMKNYKGEQYDIALGAGYAVPVIFTLENTTSKNRNVTLPAGLIVKSKNFEAQYGLLVKKVEFTVPANDDIVVLLYMNCCHLGIPAPEDNNIMEWGVITNSSLLVEICDMVKDKKINYEEFGSYTRTYFDQVYYIQERVWDLTDRGSTLTDEQREWFRNLPDSK